MNSQLFRFDGLSPREAGYIDVVDLFAVVGLKRFE